MKAIVINATGGPEQLKLQERTVRTPGPGEVLVDVVAAGVNFMDVGVRIGMHRPSLSSRASSPSAQRHRIATHDRQAIASSLIEWRDDSTASLQPFAHVRFPGRLTTPGRVLGPEQRYVTTAFHTRFVRSHLRTLSRRCRFGHGLAVRNRPIHRSKIQCIGIRRQGR